MKQKRRKRKKAPTIFALSLSQIVMTAALVLVLGKADAQCTARALPYLETFNTSSMSTCTPTNGGWVGNTTNSQAGWDIAQTNYAGGTAPEIEAYGNQANGGVSETLTLVSPPVKTLGLASVNLSFKHALNLTSSGASGSNVMTILVESSPDKSTWTSLYTNSYNATPSLTTVVTETRTLTVTGLSSDSIFLRFSVSGVLFKLWGWEIDNVNVTSGTTFISSVFNQQASVYPNPAKDKLQIELENAGKGTLFLTDAIGKTVYSSAFERNAHTIDVSGLPRGLYLMQIKNSEGIINRKIILE